MKRLLARWLAPEIRREILIAESRRVVTESKRRRRNLGVRTGYPAGNTPASTLSPPPLPRHDEEDRMTNTTAETTTTTTTEPEPPEPQPETTTTTTTTTEPDEPEDGA